MKKNFDLENITIDELFLHKKWLKHVSLITSLVIIVFLSLVLLDSKYLFFTLFLNVKFINIILFVLFLLFTLVTILFSNKTRHDNNLRKKKTNFGLYLALSGVMILNSLLLYISFEDFRIFDLINPFIIIIFGILLTISGLYFNYTYLDENIYSVIVTKKNYSIRSFLSVGFIGLYLLINAIFGYVYVLLFFIFWIDLLITKILIPLIVKIARVCYDGLKSMILFIISIPFIIYNIVKQIKNYITGKTLRSYVKTKTIYKRVYFSHKNIITLLLFSIGFSILFSYLNSVIIPVSIIQVFIILYLASSLDTLHTNLQYYTPNERVEKKYFYQFYGVFLALFLGIFEIMKYMADLFFNIDQQTAIFFSLGLISVALLLIIYQPVLLALSWVKKLLFSALSWIKKLLFSLITKLYFFMYNYVEKILIILNTFRVSSIQLFFTALGFLLLFAQLSYVYFWLFIIDLLVLWIISGTPSVKSFNQPTLSETFSSTENTMDFVIPLKIFLVTNYIAIFYIFSFLLWNVFQQYVLTISMVYIGLMLIILPNIVWITMLAKSALILSFNTAKRIISFIKFNTYYKLTFIFRINATHKIFTKNEIVRFEINTILFSLIIFLLFNQFFIIIPLLVILYLFLGLFFFILYQLSYSKTVKIVNSYKNPQDEPSEAKQFFQSIVHSLFDTQEKTNSQLKDYLLRNKTDIRLILLLPIILLTNIFYFFLNPFLISNTILTLSIAIICVAVVNLTFISNVVKLILVALLNIVNSIAQFLLRFATSLILFIRSLLYAIYNTFVQISIKLYSLFFKNGKKSLTIDFTIILVCLFISTPFIASITNSSINFSWEIFLLGYVIGLMLIWNQIIINFLSLVIQKISIFITRISKRIYSILILNGRKSWSLDLFLFVISAILLSDFTLGYNFERTLVLIGLFVMGLIIIWSASIIVVLVIALHKTIKISKVVYYKFIVLFSKLTLSLKYVIKQSINWFLFYISIFFSGIFVLFGFIYVISGLLNDSGAFMASILFDVNLLFGLAKITNVILLLLGVAFIFAGLLLMRIINENKERLFLHVFDMPKRKKFTTYEVTK